MGRAPTEMTVKNTVKTENGISNTTGIKSETPEVKMEDDSLATTPSDLTNKKRGRTLYSHLPSMKKQALSTFQEIKESIYQFPDLGESQQQDVMACECKPDISGIE